MNHENTFNNPGTPDHAPAAAHSANLPEGGLVGQSKAELLAGAHARLLPRESLTLEIAASLDYARVVAEGLVFAYSLDMPTSVRLLTDSDVERAGLEELGRAAHENLMRVPVRHDEVRTDGGALLHSVYGDSLFVASKALFLDQLVHQLTGESLPDAGALVVVPTRHLLAYHPLADGSVAQAVNDLASYALGAYEDGPGSLSPRLYWWHRGGLTSLTAIDHETRTFSIQPPPELLGLMKGLVRLDDAGRLASRTAAEAAATADTAALTRTTGEALARLAGDPSGLGDAFASALALGHAHCAADPKAARVETWDGWAAAVQLGSALFTGARAQQCYLDETAHQLPEVPAAPPADARAWLDAFYVAVVCRQQGRADRLARVPLDVLRQDESVDAYVLHWIDTLQTFWAQRPMDDVVAKLISTFETSQGQSVTRAPQRFVDLVDHQPAALFHRLITRDHDAFAEALAESVAHHGRYWDGSRAPRAQVALGPLAMACLAYDYGFPVSLDHPALPKCLVDRARIETIPE